MAIAAWTVAFVEIGAIVCLIIYTGRNQLSIANWPPPLPCRHRGHQTDHQAVQIPAHSTAPCRLVHACADLHITRAVVTPLHYCFVVAQNL